MIHSRYARALTSPIISGLRGKCQQGNTFAPGSTNISIGTFLDMSLPFRPALMNASPVHLMIAYVAANASPLKASEANSGAPSSPQLLYRTLKQAAEHASNDNDSVLLNSLDIDISVISSS